MIARAPTDIETHIRGRTNQPNALLLGVSPTASLRVKISRYPGTARPYPETAAGEESVRVGVVYALRTLEASIEHRRLCQAEHCVRLRLRPCSLTRGGMTRCPPRRRWGPRPDHLILEEDE